MLTNGFFQRMKKTQDKEKDEIQVLKINQIKLNSYHEEKQLNSKSLEELSMSIKQNGILQPITVKKVGDCVYELVSGLRRLKASSMILLDEIPVYIINNDHNHSQIIELIENLQNEEINFLEEAESYSNLLTQHGFTQEHLAQKLGKSQSTIANKIRLLKLSQTVKNSLMEYGLTERHARALLKLQDEKVQMKVLKFVSDKSLNVKKTESLIEKIIEKDSKTKIEPKQDKKFSRAMKDIREFIDTIKGAIDTMKGAGVKAKAAQLDRGDFFEFIVRIPKVAN